MATWTNKHEFHLIIFKTIRNKFITLELISNFDIRWLTKILCCVGYKTYDNASEKLIKSKYKLRTWALAKIHNRKSWAQKLTYHRHNIVFNIVDVCVWRRGSSNFKSLFLYPDINFQIIDFQNVWQEFFPVLCICNVNTTYPSCLDIFFHKINSLTVPKQNHYYLFSLLILVLN